LGPDPVVDALTPVRFVEHEARALLTRAARIKPFALTETTVVAAAFSMRAQAAIERLLAHGRHELRNRVTEFIAWLRSPAGTAASAQEIHRRFVFVRLRFNVVLSQFDVFSEVMTQRSEHETGVFLSGLDEVARDALEVPGLPFDAPPVICYLQRGQGAAIRRARTRLPGGDETPVAIVRVPRERMVGSGIASSLVHEVGHQGAALLQLVESLRQSIQARTKSDARHAEVWRLWDRWCSEMMADLWSVARIGVGSTLGLMGVVALPRPFVFRKEVDEAHPIPWIRVLLSAAFGNALYPHSQWQQVAKTWTEFYPVDGLDAEYRNLLERLQATIPDVARHFVDHRPPALAGRSLGAALATADRTPARLRTLFRRWQSVPVQMRKAPPSLVFAAIGQARADGAIAPESESRVLAHLLTAWALQSAIDTSETCAVRPTGRRKVSAA
jgi:hypothetical protein